MLPIVMVIASIVIYLIPRKPIVFDKKFGKFGKLDNKDNFEMKTIHAMQLSSHLNKTRKGWLSILYELNVVMVDGARYFLVAHPNLISIKKDANVMSKFLNISLWDRTK